MRLDHRNLSVYGLRLWRAIPGLASAVRRGIGPSDYNALLRHERTNHDQPIRVRCVRHVFVTRSWHATRFSLLAISGAGHSCLPPRSATRLLNFNAALSDINNMRQPVRRGRVHTNDQY